MDERMNWTIPITLRNYYEFDPFELTLVSQRYCNGCHRFTFSFYLHYFRNKILSSSFGSLILSEIGIRGDDALIERFP